MKKHRFYILIFLLCTAAGAAPRPVWIYLAPDADLQETARLMETYGTVRVRSKALHAVSVNLKPGFGADDLLSLPGTQSAEPVRRLYTPEAALKIPAFSKSSASVDPWYGYAIRQLSAVGIPNVHSRGYTGENVRIGILDTGFNPHLELFDKIRNEGRLIARRDFIYGDTLTEDEAEDGESGNVQTHGTGVWSVIGGFDPGTLMGGAWNAKFALAKTEDTRSETPVEEDYYAAAIEWFDSLGIDIATASLAYREFDDPELNYPASAMDGKTTVVAKICNWAAERGMIIVNAMGNEGPSAGSLWSPADSPNIISVGGLNFDGSVASFSGRGPTADGRIKPDVCARADTVFRITPSGSIAWSNGTSYSTPVIASGIALLKEVRPELDVRDVLNLFDRFADRSKNNSSGWGMPDFSRIIDYLETEPDFEVRLEAYPNPAAYLITLESPGTTGGMVRIYDILGREITRAEISVQDNIRRAYISVHRWPTGVYIASDGYRSVKFVKL